MPASHVPGQCPNVISVAGSTGHTAIPSGTAAQGGSQSLTGASLAQEASLGHILVPSNTWNPEELAPFRLQANNPRSTDFPKLKSPQEKSTTVRQQRKRNTSQPGPARHRCGKEGSLTPCHDGQTVQQRDVSRRWRQRPLQGHRPRLTQPIQEDRPFVSGQSNGSQGWAFHSALVSKGPEALLHTPLRNLSIRAPDWTPTSCGA